MNMGITDPILSAMQPGALEGIRVLDLSRFIAGPYCGMLLGDLGADVVKVETPGKGENTRSFEPKIGGESLYTIALNRNKRGMTLNFRNPDAQALLRRMIAEADIVIENFVPGTMEKMGCGWEDMQKLNSRLIMTRISGFGSTGPYAGRPCFDVVAQAMSGLMDMNGQPDGPPTFAGNFVVDYSTALYATIGTLAALQSRDKTGQGQLVEACLLNTAVSFLLTAIPDQLLHGRTATRIGSRDRYNGPANTFQAKDGSWVFIITVGDEKFNALARRMDRLDMLEDPRFSTNAGRMANLDAVEAEVQKWVRTLDADDVVEAMEVAAIPCTKIATIADLVENPQIKHAKQIIELDQPAGKVPIQGFTIKLGDTPMALRHRTPLVGEHNSEVLADWLKLDDAECLELAEKAII